MDKMSYIRRLPPTIGVNEFGSFAPLRTPEIAFGFHIRPSGSCKPSPNFL